MSYTVNRAVLLPRVPQPASSSKQAANAAVLNCPHPTLPQVVIEKLVRMVECEAYVE